MKTTPNTVTPLRSPAKPSKARRAKPISENAVSVRLPQMAEMLGIGLTKAAELVRTGAVESTLIGKTRLISVRSIEALVHGEAA
ncbi:hypothetical protein GCM10011494_02710 [Novosphingobium endophyticum]|uniref:Excisionase n=1 Tax=Novosphingobium endophyticum TaxID=1955250 RepID=A0A916TNS9_9SPHN|nr:hypothetical protein GCM10011494_02710 [Novosphingobium endophyticum]